MTVDTDRLPTLKLGSTGKAVTAAKIGVNHWNAKKANTTPVFGIWFQPLVKSFQTAHGISATGTIGPATWKALLPHLSLPAQLMLPQKPTIPNLGPITAGGQTLLDHDCTHATDGIPLYPAFDDAFTQGREIIAPEALTVTVNPRTGASFSSSNPGEAFYAIGASRICYWFGHLDRNHPPGTKFAKGAVVGKVAPNTIGGGPHCHLGVNVENLWGSGKELVHHTNYTHGAPTIGAQLEAHSIL
jgi:hypothetical protein